MEQRDIDLIDRLSSENDELRTLWTEHVELERQIDGLGRKGFRTASDDVAERELKKRKLAGRDRIERILATYR